MPSINLKSYQATYHQWQMCTLQYNKYSMASWYKQKNKSVLISVQLCKYKLQNDNNNDKIQSNSTEVKSKCQ